MNEGLSAEPVRGHVAVSQRIVPIASFAMTAAGGMLCSWWTAELFRKMKGDPTATLNGLMNSVADIGQTAVLIYGLALIVGVIGLAVTIMRSDDGEPALPGFAYLAGLPSLIPPSILAYGLYIMIAVFHTSENVDFSKVGARVAELLVDSFLAGVAALFILLPVAFLPFSVRVGKRISPIFSIGIVLIGMLALTAITFWLVGFSQEPTNPIFGK